MCGILAIVNFKGNILGSNLIEASAIIKHRGPDDEGFLTWEPAEKPQVWAGGDTSASTKNYWNYPLLKPGQTFKVGLGHRRLSILDLSPGGHQPMVYQKAGLSITFNGEVYNYLEVKEELLNLGHKFNSTSDTEVILHAWEQWGVKCLNKFNGMFAFIILDEGKKEMYAVRDRFGVKPLYYYKGTDAVYFSSEIKQIKTAPDYKFVLNEQVARQFLAIGISDDTDETFYKNITKVSPGHYMRINLSGVQCDPEIVKWYTLSPQKWVGNFDDAVVKFRALLTNAVSLRLRSDVKVGSCLSGGLDSSSIVCLSSEVLKANGDFAGQETVTSCYKDEKYDEWKYAAQVIEKTGVHSRKVFPEFGQLQEDIDTILWHQDEPCSTLSLFSGWMVAKKSHQAQLKVMLNGQGADEHLAGYGGYDLPLFSGLLGKMDLFALFGEAQHYKKQKGTWPIGFLLGALQINFGKTFSKLLPAKYRIKKEPDVDWVHHPEPSGADINLPRNLQESLINQLYLSPLPAILRFEDRNSMAWSIEFRTPFMDYRLIEFDLGLPEQFIYERGIKKKILRHAMHGIIPEAIENRKDKMGFVAPDELWFKGEGKAWLMEGIDKACKQFDGHLLNAGKVNTYISEMMEGKREFNSIPWRIFCFQRWFNNV